MLTGRMSRSAQSARMTQEKNPTFRPDTAKSRAAGKGMPAKSPRPDRAPPGEDDVMSQRDGARETSLEMPHERDQHTDMTGNRTSPLIEQAAKDVGNGLQDTSKAVETDRTYRKL